MKRFSKSVLGVTLLEIMLVLAVAATIIVMSVRYYQSAAASQQTNSAVEQVQAIIAAADGLAQATGSYSAVTTSGLTSLLPSNAMTTAWGGSIVWTKMSASTYTLALAGVPAAVCPLLKVRLTASKNITLTTGSCGATSGSLTFTYTANP